MYFQHHSKGGKKHLQPHLFQQEPSGHLLLWLTSPSLQLLFTQLNKTTVGWFKILSGILLNIHAVFHQCYYKPGTKRSCLNEGRGELSPLSACLSSRGFIFDPGEKTVAFDWERYNEQAWCRIGIFPRPKNERTPWYLSRNLASFQPGDLLGLMLSCHVLFCIPKSFFWRIM